MVLVNGVPSANPRTRVRADAAIRIHRPRPLRGTIKLAHALTAFGVRAAGAVALDLGAAAGGFTQALLDAGAARVYAVDAGTGQLRGMAAGRPPGHQPGAHQPGPARPAPHRRAGGPDDDGPVLPGRRRRHRPGRPAAPGASRSAHRADQADLRAARRRARRPAAADRRRRGCGGMRAGRPWLAGAGPAAIAHPRSEGSGPRRSCTRRPAVVSPAGAAVSFRARPARSARRARS